MIYFWNKKNNIFYMNKLISKYYNFNLGKFPGTLSDQIFFLLHISQKCTLYMCTSITNQFCKFKWLKNHEFSDIFNGLKYSVPGF